MQLFKYVSGVTTLRWHANRRYEEVRRGIIRDGRPAPPRRMRMANDSDYRDTFLSMNECLRVVKCGVDKGL